MVYWTLPYMQGIEVKLHFKGFQIKGASFDSLVILLLQLLLEVSKEGVHHANRCCHTCMITSP